MATSKQKLQLAAALLEIIPLDPESCSQAIEYALSLPSDAEVHDHFLNMLGESDATTAFLVKFSDVKNSSNIAAPVPQTVHKPVLGNPWTTNIPKNTNASKTTTKLAPKSAPKTTSDLVADERIKLPQPNRKTRKKQLKDLKDLESVLASLELSQNDGSPQVCNCNATRHPLFEIAPNCLNCGKIICAKEGLQPCSFCGQDPLSAKDRNDIKQVLLKEKQQLSVESSPQPERRNLPKPKPKKIVVSMKTGGEKFWKVQDAAFKQAEEQLRLQQEQEEQERLFKEAEQEKSKQDRYLQSISGVDPDLVAAQERLNTLLEFQDNGEERTKIIDNAADYEIASSNSGNMWLSATERALKLKKQQKQLRKHEENEQQRIGKGKRTVEMVIKDGKVTMVEKYSGKDDDGKDSEEIKALEDEIKLEKRKNEEVSQSIWDFEVDKDKWQKPVYSLEREFVSLDVSTKKRVQFGGDQSELVASMY